METPFDKINDPIGLRVAAGLSRLALESDLRNAFLRGEIEPFYQPVVNLQTGAVAGFEGLAGRGIEVSRIDVQDSAYYVIMRWRRDIGQSLPPEPPDKITGTIFGRSMLANPSDG